VGTRRKKDLPLTYTEKAERVAEWAEWCANIARHHNGRCGSLEPLVDRAYAALRESTSELYARDSICAALYSFAHHSSADDRTKVENFRELLRVTIEEDDYNPLKGNADAVSEDTIISALKAWARAPGRRSGGAADKWEATLKVLKECGVGQNVSPDALKRAWGRLRPKLVTH
jgi:hypothetical protein